MALSAPTNRTNAVSGHNVTTLSTSSFTPSNNSLLVVFVTGTCSAAAAPGRLHLKDTLGYNWSEVTTYMLVGNATGASNCYVSVWYTQVGTGAATTLTASTDGQVQNIAIQVAEFTGHDTIEPIVGCYQERFVGTYNSSWSATFPKTPDTNNCIVMASLTDRDTPADADITTGTGWTQLNEVTSDTFVRTHYQYRSGSTSTTIGLDHIETIYSQAFIAVEVQADQGGQAASPATNMSGVGSRMKTSNWFNNRASIVMGMASFGRSYSTTSTTYISRQVWEKFLLGGATTTKYFAYYGNRVSI